MRDEFDNHLQARPDCLIDLSDISPEQSYELEAESLKMVNRPLKIVINPWQRIAEQLSRRFVCN